MILLVFSFLTIFRITRQFGALKTQLVIYENVRQNIWNIGLFIELIKCYDNKIDTMDVYFSDPFLFFS